MHMTSVYLVPAVTLYSMWSREAPIDAGGCGRNGDALCSRSFLPSRSAFLPRVSMHTLSYFPSHSDLQ